MGNGEFMFQKMKDELRRIKESGEYDKRRRELEEEVGEKEHKEFGERLRQAYWEDVRQGKIDPNVVKEGELHWDGEPLTEEQLKDVLLFLEWVAYVRIPDIENKWLTPEDVAKRFNVSVETVNGWIESGELKVATLKDGGPKISEERLNNFLWNRVSKEE